MTPLQPRHLINWQDWSDNEIQRLVLLAQEIKENPNDFSDKLAQKTLVMIFQKTSTRTRVSFEVAMTEMGGHAIFLDWNSSNFALTEISFESAYLSRNSQILMARMMKHEDLLKLRQGSRVPVINGCCDRYHPCQALADMLTIYQDRGKLEGAKLTYLGVHNNVVNSLVSLCASLKVQLTLVCPLARPGAVDEKAMTRLKTKNLLTQTLDAKAAVADADYVYTDTWIDMEFFNDPDKQTMKEERIALMRPYQINAELLAHSRAKVMHDMPIHPGFEISHEMVEDPRSILYTQAENRLYAQKAILLNLLRAI